MCRVSFDNIPVSCDGINDIYVNGAGVSDDCVDGCSVSGLCITNALLLIMFVNDLNLPKQTHTSYFKFLTE